MNDTVRMNKTFDIQTDTIILNKKDLNGELSQDSIRLLIKTKDYLRSYCYGSSCFSLT